jgi:hypothetical protein
MGLRTDSCQVCFRVGRDTADLLNTLASRQGGMRPLILGWLADAGYADVAQRDLARPDGRRRQTLPCAGQVLAVERQRLDPTGGDRGESGTALCGLPKRGVDLPCSSEV